MLQTNGESRLRSFTAHMVRWPAAPWTLREYVSFNLECYVRLPGREKKQSPNPQPGPHRVLASLARSRLGVHEVAPELIILKPNGARQPVDRRTSRREPKGRRAHSPTANLTFRQVRSGISLDHGADLQQPGVMGGWGGEVTMICSHVWVDQMQWLGFTTADFICGFGRFSGPNTNRPGVCVLQAYKVPGRGILGAGWLRWLAWWLIYLPPFLPP